MFHCMTETELVLNTDQTKFLISQRQREQVTNVFPTPLLSQPVMHAVSTWNVGLFLWQL